jgi:hypothetical protein
MTRDELKQLKRSLSMLSPHTVRDNYQKMLEKCQLCEGALPTPRMMRELVTLWEVLRIRRNSTFSTARIAAALGALMVGWYYKAAFLFAAGDLRPSHGAIKSDIADSLERGNSNRAACGVLSHSRSVAYPRI